MGNKESIKSFFAEHATTVRKRWFEALVSDYPEESARHIRKNNDQFANPVGYVIGEVADSVVKGLAENSPASEIAGAMYPLIRIKAVQSFTPAEAVSCVLSLKRTVRDVLDGVGPDDSDQIRTVLDSVFDEMLFLCFNQYSDCRDKLHEIKEDELKRNLYMLLKRSGAVDGQGQGEG